MERREALKRISVLLGGAVSFSTASGILGGCKAGSGQAPFVPQTLTSDQNRLVTTVSELIIPKTDTGGAAEARVNEFIDKMLTDWFEPEDKNRFLQGLADLDFQSAESMGKPFLDLTHDEQVQVLEGLEADRVRWRQGVIDGTDDRSAPPFFQLMRELTISGYYTSEIGAAQELKYEIIFNAYEGDVPYEEIGRAWS